jgi:hypothetical protein
MAIMPQALAGFWHAVAAMAGARVAGQGREAGRPGVAAGVDDAVSAEREQRYAIPYGIYGEQAGPGFVNVGTAGTPPRWPWSPSAAGTRLTG